ncbi:MAG: hypothetical protein HYX75_13740 [Acidobacteria bacterium]|nr:hypothetical protein [Acidobacteriota bacterium]
MIPNQFHFVFGLRRQTEPFHLCHYLCIESCYQVNRPDRIFLYYRHEPYGPYWELAKRRLTLVRVALPRFIWKFRYTGPNRACRPYRYAHHSDYIRLERLFESGGVYADIDTIFVQKLPAALFGESFVLGREGDIVCQATGRRQPSLCNALIMSTPKAAFGRLWLDAFRDAFDGSWSRHSTLLPQDLSERSPHLLHIEPSHSFYKHMWTREGIRTLLQGYDPDFEGVYSMHLWSHLWWSKARRDFSDFHAGLLTKDYIAKVDTTYNVVARAFLPADGPERLGSAWLRRLIGWSGLR